MELAQPEIEQQCHHHTSQYGEGNFQLVERIVASYLARSAVHHKLVGLAVKVEDAYP